MIGFSDTNIPSKLYNASASNTSDSSGKVNFSMTYLDNTYLNCSRLTDKISFTGDTLAG